MMTLFSRVTRICDHCGSDLKGRQLRFCSDKCRNGHHNTERPVSRKGQCCTQAAPPPPGVTGKIPRQGKSHGGRLDTDSAAGRAYRFLRSRSKIGRGEATGLEVMEAARTTGLSRTISAIRDRLPDNEMIPPPRMVKGRKVTVSWYRLVIK